MPPSDAVVVTVAILLAVGRIAGLTDEAFQAAAHLFVGGVFVAWRYSRRSFHKAVFWGVTIVEGICFLVGRFHS
jgi:hypothetical protein